MRLTGTLVTESGRSAGVGIYDRHTRAPPVSSDDTFAVKWLADSRRAVYFAKHGSQLVVLDTLTRQRTLVDVRLPGAATADEMFAISRDNPTIDYGASHPGGTIWKVERSRAAAR